MRKGFLGSFSPGFFQDSFPLLRSFLTGASGSEEHFSLNLWSSVWTWTGSSKPALGPSSPWPVHRSARPSTGRMLPNLLGRWPSSSGVRFRRSLARTGFSFTPRSGWSQTQCGFLTSWEAHEDKCNQVQEHLVEHIPWMVWELVSRLTLPLVTMQWAHAYSTHFFCFGKFSHDKELTVGSSPTTLALVNCILMHSFLIHKECSSWLPQKRLEVAAL